MMQVAAEDTHQDYVVCRGYDPRIRKFIDYDEEDLENKPGIPVGKPYGKRSTGKYQVGQVFAAAIPVTRIGETPGVAATSQGHPADLDELIEILYDDDGVVVTWLLLDGGGDASFLHWGLVTTDLEQGGTCTIQEYTYGAGGYDYTYSGGCTAGEIYENCRDPLGEMSATAGIAGAIFWVDANGNALIIRVTCPGFTFTPCASSYYDGYSY